MRTALLVALLAAGCSADRVDAGPDATPSIAPDDDDEGGVIPRPDAAPGESPACGLAMPADIGQAGMVTATSKGVSAGKYSVYLRLQSDPYVDLLISAETGRGAFVDGVVPGPYEITGKETDYEWCSACVYMFSQNDSGPATHVMASSGTLEITAVQDGKLSGSIEDVTLQAIEIVRDSSSTTCETSDDCENTACQDDLCGRQQPIDGCSMSIGSLSF